MSNRRKIIAWLAGGVLALVFIGLGFAWFVVTEPIFGTSSPLRVPAVDPTRLEKHVRYFAEDLLPRDWKHPESLDKGAEYIRDEFTASGAKASEQSYSMEGQTYRNMIGSFGPDVGATIVVGAHYDAAGELPGADDNASSVAGLLELARLLGNTPPSVPVELVAFTLEEPKALGGVGLFRSPFGGSAVHAASLVKEQKKIRIVIDLEMIGFFSDDDGSQSYPVGLLSLIYPSRGDFITIIGKLGQGTSVRRVKSAMRAASSLPVYSMSAPAFVEGIDWSDHTNYWNAGYEAVMISDTAFYRNTAYHTIHDTPDRLDFKRMAMAVQGVYAAVFEFAR